MLMRQLNTIGGCVMLKVGQIIKRNGWPFRIIERNKHGVIAKGLDGQGNVQILSSEEAYYEKDAINGK